MLRYRPEIDGLRAIAVLPVILYHAEFAAIPGGYVGVDVFFVISGYLITALILKDLQKGHFSFLTFWARRARRILPASITVMLACLFAGWILLGPQEYEQLAKTAAIQSVFLSNIYFNNKDSDYFSPAVEDNPLLHSWSLAVEEQFYLILPLILVLAVRFMTFRLSTAMIAVLAAISLTASIRALEGAQVAVFYLLPYRAWELLLGAILAFPVANRIHKLPALLREGLGLAGLGMIAWAVLMFSDRTAFPGAAALLPCLGAALFIIANTHALTLSGRALSWKPVVAIGLISYSLYLWHWPLFVFARVTSFEPLQSWHYAALIFATFALAVLSYRFVERPFRYGLRAMHPGKVLSAGLAGMIGGALVAALIISKDGVPQRLPEQAQTYFAGREDYNPRRDECVDFNARRVREGRFCKAGPDAEGEAPDLLVIGDSHADMLMPVLTKIAETKGVSVWFAMKVGCLPLHGIFRNKPDGHCPLYNEALFEAIEKRNIPHVMLVGRWSVNVLGHVREDSLRALISDSQTRSATVGDAKSVFARRFPATVESLRDNGTSVWIVRQVPLQTADVPAHLGRMAMQDADPEKAKLPLEKHKQRQSFANSVIDRTARNRPHVHVIDPADILCNEQACRMEKNGQALYRDNNHLSRYGSLQLEAVFEKVFKQIKAEKM